MGTGGVESYYDRHTWIMRRFETAQHGGAIHRPVWAPGVRDLEGALCYVVDRVANALSPEAARIADLGCGENA